MQSSRYIRPLHISSVFSHLAGEQVAARDAGQTTERTRTQTHEQQWNSDLMMQKKSLFPQYWLMDQRGTKKELKMLIEKHNFKHSDLTTNRNQHLYLHYEWDSNSNDGKSYVSSPWLTESSELFTDFLPRQLQLFRLWSTSSIGTEKYTTPTSTSIVICQWKLAALISIVLKSWFYFKVT